MMMQSPGGNDDAAKAASGLGQKTDTEAATAGTTAEPSAPPPEEVEDPAFNARWNAYVVWLEAHWIDQYPEMTEEEWNAWTLSVMIDMVYEGVAP